MIPYIIACQIASISPSSLSYHYVLSGPAVHSMSSSHIVILSFSDDGDDEDYSPAFLLLCKLPRILGCWDLYNFHRVQ